MSKDLQKAPSANAALMANFKGELQKVVPYLKTLLGRDESLQRFIQMAHLALMRDPNSSRPTSRSSLWP